MAELEVHATSRSVIVSGVSGLLGRTLAERLTKSKMEVHGLTRQEIPRTDPLAKVATLHRIQNDTTEMVRLFQELRPQVVIHLAALARRRHETIDVSPFVESNILFGTQLLEAARVCGCKKFVTAESILQFSEIGKDRPLNLYAATKQAFANLLSYYSDTFDIFSMALVLPTIYSEYEEVPKLMTDTALAFQTGTPLNLGPEEVPIDFVHADDVADAFIQAFCILQKEPAQSQGFLRRYWVSSEMTIIPTDLVKLFERICKKEITIQKPAAVGSTRRGRPYQGPTLPGWVPKIDLETGIRRMLSIQR